MTSYENGFRAGIEAAAKKATSFLVGDPANGVPLRSPSPHQIAEAIRALSPAAPEPGKTNDDGCLWCVHVIGPDDVHPAPDFGTAWSWAAAANRAFAGKSGDVLLRFTVALWPFDADGHAEGLKSGGRTRDIDFPALAKAAAPEPTKDEVARAERAIADLVGRSGKNIAIVDIARAALAAARGK